MVAAKTRTLLRAPLVFGMAGIYVICELLHRSYRSNCDIDRFQTIGREGMVGVPVALGVRTTPLQFVIQHAGDGLRMTSHHLEEVIDERPSLHCVLLRYAQVMSMQASDTAFANAEHTVETRLARWLLMCHDRIDGDDIPITHEFMAMMLGVRRAGVTTATQILEGNGLIAAKRGIITVLDREKLEALADNAYGLPEAEYARQMAEGQ